MKIRNILLVSLAICAVLMSCRRTEDDPLSIRTRKARLTGKWKVTGGYIEQNDNVTNGSNLLFKFTLSETTASLYFSVSDATYYGYGSDNVVYKEEFEFMKDGKFTHDMKFDSDTWDEEGEWNFTDGVGDRNARTELLLMYNESITSYYGKETWQGEINSFVYDILELHMDKVILMMQWKHYDNVTMKYLYYTEYKVLEKVEEE